MIKISRQKTLTTMSSSLSAIAFMVFALGASAPAHSCPFSNASPGQGFMHVPDNANSQAKSRGVNNNRTADSGAQGSGTSQKK